MKNRTILLITILALAASTMACGVSTFTSSSLRTIDGNGVVVEESREVGSFNEVQLSGIGTIYVEYGNETSLVIEAEENLIEYIETDTFGKKLVIGTENGRSLDPTEQINFYLTVVELEGVQISGLGSIYLPEVNADRFEIKISGAGDVNIEALYADKLDASLSGLGDVDIEGGEVFSQDVSISGSGTYSAHHLKSSEADVSVSGLGSATVFAEDYLVAGISGAGDINYYGSPEVDMNITGLGSLESLEE